MEFLGLAVKNDRTALGLTQKHLQEMVDKERGNSFDNYFISKIERGIAREVSVKKRRLLAHLLNQSPDRYLGLGDPIGSRLVCCMYHYNFVFRSDYSSTSLELLAGVAELTCVLLFRHHGHLSKIRMPTR